MQQQDNVDSVEERRVRRGYATPQLTVYGALSDLTAAGSGQSSESGGSFMNCAQGYKLAMACQ